MGILKSKQLWIDTPEPFIPGNTFDKYRSAKFVHRMLIRGFLDDARGFIASLRPSRILEVGCGPGDLGYHLFGTSPDGGGGAGYVGIDISNDEVVKARTRYPDRAFSTASIYRLPFPTNAFDLVIACEVLEHLERPGEALREIERVCRSHLIVSVPWEPVWRGLNLVRGKYVRRLGNTPGHVQHFSRTAIRHLVGSRFDIIDERRPLPWTMLLARRKFA